MPSFSVVTPTRRNSQYNGFSLTEGDNWVGSVVSAIEHGPDWSSTAIFLTWDDCGCFYDPVSPPNGWGIRVPMIIVSPYAKSRYTDSTPTTYAGILAFVEHTFGLPALSEADATAYDFSNSFDYRQEPIPPVRMTTTAVPASSLRYLRTHAPSFGDDPT